MGGKATSDNTTSRSWQDRRHSFGKDQPTRGGIEPLECSASPSLRAYRIIKPGISRRLSFHGAVRTREKTRESRFPDRRNHCRNSLAAATARVVECQLPGMQGDPLSRNARRGQAAPVEPVPYDRTAMGCQLDPQLMPPSGFGPQLHQRHLPCPLAHSRHGDRRDSRRWGPFGVALVTACCITTPGTGINNHSPPRGLMPVQSILPSHPSSQRRRKSFLDHREILFRHRSFSKLFGQAGCRPAGLCKNHDPRNRLIQPADNTQEGIRSESVSKVREKTRCVPGGIRRRQPSRFIEYDDVIVLEEHVKAVAGLLALRLLVWSFHPCHHRPFN